MSSTCRRWVSSETGIDARLDRRLGLGRVYAARAAGGGRRAKE